MRRVALVTAVVLATLTAVFLLWQFHLVVILFALSLFVAAAIRPMVTRLVAFGLPTGVARLAIYGALIAGFGGMVALISRPLAAEVRLFSNEMAIEYQSTYTAWSNGTAMQEALAARLPDPVTLFESAAGEQGEQLIQTAVDITTAVLTALGSLIAVMVLSIYWSSDQDRFERLWLSLLPADKRVRARESWRALESAIGDYWRSELLQSVLGAVLLGLGYWSLGITYPILLALLAALAWLIPLAGAVLILIPVFLAGLQISLAIAVSAALYTLFVLLFLELVVEPRIFDRHWYSNFLLLLTIIPLVDSIGLIGFFAAPPLAAAIQVFLRLLFDSALYPSTTAVQLEQLQKRYDELNARIQEGEIDVDVTPEISSLLERLRNLIDEARRVSATAPVAMLAGAPADRPSASLVPPASATSPGRQD